MTSPARQFSMRYADGVTAVVLGLAAVAMLGNLPDVDGIAQALDVRTPAFFPLLAGILLLTLSALLGLRSVLRRRGAGIAITNPWRLVACSLALGLATVGIFTVGLLPTAFLLVIALASVFDYRSYRLTFLVALACPLAVYLLFEVLLQVPLPRGTWG